MTIEDKIRAFARQSQPPSADTRAGAIELVDLLRLLGIRSINALTEGAHIIVYGYGRSMSDDPIYLEWTVLGEQVLFRWEN